MKYTQRVREEGGSGSPPPPSTIHLRIDDIRDNIIPTAVTQNVQWPLEWGRGGGVSNGRFPWTKCDFCSEV